MFVKVYDLKKILTKKSKKIFFSFFLNIYREVVYFAEKSENLNLQKLFFEKKFLYKILNEGLNQVFSHIVLNRPCFKREKIILIINPTFFNEKQFVFWIKYLFYLWEKYQSLVRLHKRWRLSQEDAVLMRRRPKKFLHHNKQVQYLALELRLIFP